MLTKLNRAGEMVSKRRQQDQRNGVAAVELATCLPLILLLTLATVQATQMFYLRQTLTVSAYEGIREAVDHKTTDAQVRAACNRILDDRGVQNATIDVSPSDYLTAPPETWITVTVSAPSNSNSPVRGWFFKDKTIQGAATFMKEF